MIRPETFSHPENWVEPTPQEVRELLRVLGWNVPTAVAKCGIRGKQANRRVRDYQTDFGSGVSTIPYGIWAIMAYHAGKGIIFEDSRKELE
jgi:hypothetical protein